MATPVGNNKALMTHYAEGALVSRELHDMMHQYAADARFDAELSGHEDNYDLMRRAYGRGSGEREPRREKT